MFITSIICEVKFVRFVRNVHKECTGVSNTHDGGIHSRDKNDRHILRDVRLTVGFLLDSSCDILSAA